MMAKMEGAFCVLCGRQGVELHGALCTSCAVKKGHPVTIPDRIRIVVCPFCGARERGRHWERGPPPGLFHGKDLDPNVEVTPPFAVKSITWEESGRNPAVRTFTGRAVVMLGQSTIDVPLMTELKVVSHTCPTCSRKSGSYYTAKIQFRKALERGVERTSEEFKDTMRWIWEVYLQSAPRTQRESVAWTEDLKEGLDVYLLDTTAAKGLARELKQKFGATMTESATLWGVKDGRKTYRTTILLRFPRVLTGDFFERKGELYQVRRTEGEKYRIVPLKGGEEQVVDADNIISDFRFVGGADKRCDSILEKVSPPQVLHPVTRSSLPLRGLDDSAAKEGERVSVVLDGEEAWWVSPLALKRKKPSK